METKPPFVRTRIFISGASGALGCALALRLAYPGVSLSLWGRDRARLDRVAGACRARGAHADIRSLDFADLDAALALLKVEDETEPFDLAFLLAGQGDTLPPDKVVEDPAQVARLAHTNFTAPAAMAAALATRMATRGMGRIGVAGTAAASHSLPFAAAYSGSKAGLSRYVDALRLAVSRHGVTVTLVSPGFFSGTAESGPAPSRPGEISADEVAGKMIAAVRTGRAELVVPRRFLLLRWFDRLLPRPLRDRVLRSLRAP